jgi:transposase
MSVSYLFPVKSSLFPSFVNTGEVVKAIILNGLGFVSRPLYLFPDFFQDKPIEHLIKEGIKASDLNDDKIVSAQ